MIAIVPARGGSKGLPGKNIKMLAGKPMIAYTIEEALKSKYISEVIISTDSQEIANVAVSYGAKCPFMRPHYLASDESLAVDCYLYTIQELCRLRNCSIDELVILQPTSPLRLAEDIDGAISCFYEKHADSVVSYVAESHPLFWHKYLNEDGSFENIFEDELRNRQGYRKSYYPNGAVYVFKAELLKKQTYHTEKSYMYIMSRDRSVDIDDWCDFEYAEFLLGRRCEK